MIIKSHRLRIHARIKNFPFCIMLNCLKKINERQKKQQHMAVRLQTVFIHLGTPSSYTCLNQLFIKKKNSLVFCEKLSGPRSKRAGHTHNIAAHRSRLSTIHHFHSLPIRSLHEQTISVSKIWITLLLMQPWIAPSLIHAMLFSGAASPVCTASDRMKMRAMDDLVANT